MQTRNHVITVPGIAPPPTPPHNRRDSDRPRALLYTEGDRVELHVVARDGLILDGGAARLLAAALLTAAVDAERAR